MAPSLPDDVRSLALSDADIMAATLWGEARGERLMGRIAIGCVIRNRMARRKQTASQVCLSRLQFSCWWPTGGAANHAALRALIAGIATTADPVWRECQWIAEGILGGACGDVTRGADHYLTTRLLGSPDKPAWVSKMTCVGVIESHTFYRS